MTQAPIGRKQQAIIPRLGKRCERERGPVGDHDAFKIGRSEEVGVCGRSGLAGGQ